MIHSKAVRPKESEGGFTLVELLVVIVILGILSAVVVFAVRGADDKGKGAAVATDERTIRTAQEAYCAKAGHYATMDQLTGAVKANDGVNTYKFLSQESGYHAVTFKPGPGGGSCNGTGYEIACKDGSTMPNCGVPIPERPPVGKWLEIGDLPLPSSRGQLNVITDTGKVVLLGYGELTGDHSAVYDAASRSWIPTTTIPFTTGAVAIPGSPSPLCPNCGKVLVHRAQAEAEWALYDPLSEAVVPLPPSTRECRLNTSLTALADGTILSVGCSASTGSYTKKAEIFDPKLAVGSPWKALPDMTHGRYDALAVRLDGGCADPPPAPARCDRVLVTGQLSEETYAEIYDPSISIGSPWIAAGNTSIGVSSRYATMTLLGDGRVLLMSGHGKAQLYSAVDGWSQPMPCVCPFGHSATLLASGRVLVAGGDSGTPSRSASLFNPADDSWLPAEDIPFPGRFAHGALLLQGKSCAPKPEDCSKVLVAGGTLGDTEKTSTVLYSETA